MKDGMSGDEEGMGRRERRGGEEEWSEEETGDAEPAGNQFASSTCQNLVCNDRFVYFPLIFLHCRANVGCPRSQRLVALIPLRFHVHCVTLVGREVNTTGASWTRATLFASPRPWTK